MLEGIKKFIYLRNIISAKNDDALQKKKKKEKEKDNSVTLLLCYPHKGIPVLYIFFMKY